MRRFFVIVFLLLYSAGLSAQVDSFIVQGKTFRFEIPQDWVVEEKLNDVQGDSSWNYIIRYGIDNAELNARIAVKVEKRQPQNNDPVIFKKKTIVSYGYTPMGNGEGAFAHIEYPEKKCTSCRKEYTDINLYYLNAKLNLVLVFYGTGKKKSIDSLRSVFNPFSDQLFARNASTIDAFRPLLHATPVVATDSFFAMNRFFRFFFDPGWTAKTEKESNTQITRLNLNSGDVTIYVDHISSGVQENIPVQNSRKPSRDRHLPGPDLTIKGKITKDYSTAGRSVFLKPTYVHCVTQLSFAVRPDTLPDSYLLFSICYYPEPGDYLYNLYYKKLLEDFVRKFLADNGLNSTVILEEIGPAGINRSQSIPISSPAEKPKRTTVD